MSSITPGPRRSFRQKIEVEWGWLSLGIRVKMAKLRLTAYVGTPTDMLARLRESLIPRVSFLFESIEIDGAEIEAPPSSFDRVRKQYVADPFLHALDGRSTRTEHILGLVDLDLYVTGLNFIFGLAEQKRNAIVALPRLRQSFYGLKDLDGLFYSRVTKESIHELGHVVGLPHCQKRCVMRFSNSLEDTDRKPDAFCSDCVETLKKRE